MIIELDGAIHQYQLEYDAGRTYELGELGYRVIRFTNEDVLDNWGVVEKRMLDFIREN